jgi:hypothetical protein
MTREEMEIFLKRVEDMEKMQTDSIKASRKLTRKIETARGVTRAIIAAVKEKIVEAQEG